MFISDSLYRSIITSVPISCVDFFITHKNKVLLGKRCNEPLCGQWCFPGGRVHIGESVSQAISRKLKEEVGIEWKNEDTPFVGVYDTIFQNNAFEENQLYHTVNRVYHIRLDDSQAQSITPDSQNEHFAWFSVQQDNSFHEYINQVIGDYLSQIS